MALMAYQMAARTFPNFVTPHDFEPTPLIVTVGLVEQMFLPMRSMLWAASTTHETWGTSFSMWEKAGLQAPSNQSTK